MEVNISPGEPGIQRSNNDHVDGIYDYRKAYTGFKRINTDSDEINIPWYGGASHVKYKSKYSKRANTYRIKRKKKNKQASLSRKINR